MNTISIKYPDTVSTRFLAAASIAVLIALSSPAIAQNNTTKPPTIEQRVDHTWQDTKDVVRDTAHDVSDKAEDMYDSARKAWTDRNNIQIENVSITSRATATGMIGKPIYNMNGQPLATIKDILIDPNGKALLVILSDNNFLGLGKVVAFDYNAITRTSEKGDIISSLSKEMIDSAAEFTLEPDRSSEGTTMQRHHISLSRLLDGHLVAPNGERLADIDNLTLQNGKVDKIIVGYNKILFMGGKQAALNFNDTKISYNALGETNVLLTQGQTNQFKAYKNAEVY